MSDLPLHRFSSSLPLERRPLEFEHVDPTATRRGDALVRPRSTEGEPGGVRFEITGFTTEQEGVRGPQLLRIGSALRLLAS